MANTPPLCTQAGEWLIDACDAKLIANTQSLKISDKLRNTLTAGGFKLNDKILATRKKHILNNLNQLGDDAMFFANLAVQSHGPWKALYPVLKLFPEETVRQYWRTLVENASAPGVIVLALYMFPKDSMQHKLALRLLKRPAAWKEQSEVTPFYESLSTVLANCLAPFSGILQKQLKTTEEPKEKLSDKDLEKKLDKEYKRGRADQEKKNAEERRELAAKLKDTSTKLAEADKTIKQLNEQIQQERQQAETNLQQQAQIALQNQQKAVDDFRKQVLLDNVELHVDTAQSQITTDKLLETLRKATDAQLEMNRNSGSKHALRTQRDALLKALEDLQLAANDSFQHVKNLNEIVATTRRHLNEIEQKLGEAPSHSLAFLQLEALVSSIKLDQNAEQTLKKVSVFIHHAGEHDMLLHHEIQRLDALVAKRKNLLKSLKLAPLEKALETLEQEETKRQRPEIWNFTKHSTLLPKVTLIFDGYNAMKRNELWLQIEQRNSFDVARKHFVRSIQSKQNCFKNVEIVFDGTGTTTTYETITDRFKVVYAAHINEEHNADDFIVERVINLRCSETSDLIWVVTNDYDLREQLQDYCDAFVETSAIPGFFTP